VDGLPLVLAAFPLSRRLAVLPEWRDLMRVMTLARVLGPVCYVLFAVSSSLPSMPDVGLIERALAAVCAGWVLALSVNLVRQSGHDSRALARNLVIRS
jgi:hypothetical protein